MQYQSSGSGADRDDVDSPAGASKLSTPSARPAWTSASACATIGAALPALMLGVRRDATGSVWDDDRIQAEQE